MVELDPGLLKQFEPGVTAFKPNALTTGPRLLPKRILNHDAFYEHNQFSSEVDNDALLFAILIKLVRVELFIKFLFQA
mgnify:CR=1 FL=1